MVMDIEKKIVYLTIFERAVQVASSIIKSPKTEGASFCNIASICMQTFLISIGQPFQAAMKKHGAIP